MSRHKAFKDCHSTSHLKSSSQLSPTQAQQVAFMKPLNPNQVFLPSQMCLLFLGRMSSKALRSALSCLAFLQILKILHTAASHSKEIWFPTQQSAAKHSLLKSQLIFVLHSARNVWKKRQHSLRKTTQFTLVANKSCQILSFETFQMQKC